MHVAPDAGRAALGRRQWAVVTAYQRVQLVAVGHDFKMDLVGTAIDDARRAQRVLAPDLGAVDDRIR